MKGCHKELKEIASAMKGIEVSLEKTIRLRSTTANDCLVILRAITELKFRINNIIGMLAITYRDEIFPKPLNKDSNPSHPSDHE